MKKIRVAIFLRDDNPSAKNWRSKIEKHIRQNYPHIEISDVKPKFVVALGGDGTILEATRTHRRSAPIVVGLNLGHIGFLASARRQKNFIPAIDRMLSGSFAVSKRMLLKGELRRGGKIVHTTHALNEIALQGLLGAIKTTVTIDEYQLQHIHGNGVLVSTPTGSTAYNLSAHGPIVTPDINCIIVTEILDHNIPTPPIVVKRNKRVVIDITEIRKRGLLSISKTGKAVDAVLTADDMDPFPIEEGDRVTISRSAYVAKFAEFEKGYFLKSLHEKFAFE